MQAVAWLTVPDQTSLDEGNFLGEDSKEWPTRKKKQTNITSQHAVPKFNTNISQINLSSRLIGQHFTQQQQKP